MGKPHTHEAPSALMTMHRRYEQAQAEYEIIDTAHQTAKNNDDSETFLLENAGQTSVKEADALRLAILYQVPADIPEAAVLQFHIAAMHDMITGSEPRRELEEEALSIAIRTLLDFLACEMKEDHEEHVGGFFRDDAARAYFERRRRTGDMGE